MILTATFETYNNNTDSKLKRCLHFMKSFKISNLLRKYCFPQEELEN